MRVAVINGGHAYHNMFRKAGFDVVYNEMDADLLCFTGGADVTPSFYGQGMHPYTRTNPARDAEERLIFERFHDTKKMVGICRGGQFLNVMMGGSLWQDVDNHALTHTHKAVDIPTGREYDVTSTHHQMIVPAEGGEVIATASESSYKELHSYGEIVREEDPIPDVEAVVYDQQVLCFQPHPEFFGATDTCNYFFHLLERELGVTA